MILRRVSTECKALLQHIPKLPNTFRMPLNQMEFWNPKEMQERDKIQ